MPQDRQALGTRSFLRRHPALILLVVAIAIVSGPILSRGLTSGGDLVEHIRLADAYRGGILSGRVFPDWTLDNHGRGSTAVRVYPPIVPLTTAAIWLLAGDIYSAFTICLSFWLFASMLGTFLLVRDLTDEKAALIGAIACGLAPHHLALIFKFSFYAEFAALGVLPFCFLFLRRLVETNRWIDALCLAVAVSLLILTHLPMSVIGIPLLLLFAIGMRPGFRRMIECSRNLALAAVVALLLTSVFWLRWIFERDWIAHFNARYTEGLFSFEKWLFPVGVFVERAMPHVPSTLFLNSELLITVIPLFVGLVGLLVLRKCSADDARHKLLSALVIAGSACAVMVTWLSYPVWIMLSVLRKIQFPFRFLTVLSVIGGALIALWIGQTQDLSGRLRSASLAALFLLGTAVVVFDVRMIFFYPYVKNAPEMSDLVTDIRNREGPPWWLPVNASNDSLGELPSLGLGGDRKVEIVNFDREQRSFHVEAGSQADQLNTATYYYPYWHVKLNEQRVEPAVDEKGVMIVPLPQGPSRVEVTFSEPFIYRIAKITSLVAWIIAIAALGLGVRSRRMQDSLPPSVQ